MKRIISVILFISLLCSFGITAFAAQTGEDPLPAIILLSEDEEAETDTAAEAAAVLRDVQMITEGGQNLLVKTWEVPADYDPNKLTETDIEKGGYRYSKSYLMLVSENRDVDTKLASQIITVTHSTKGEATAKLLPLLEYEQDGYKGQLELQNDSIYTEATKKTGYSYVVNDIKEYGGLDRNDPFGIPKTTVKGGVTLDLTDIEWTRMGEENYRATAYYSGIASGTNVSEYSSTATYMGEVTKDNIGSMTYAVVYEGTPVPLPAPVYWPYILAVVLMLAAAAAAIYFWKNRRNAKIYALVDGEYRVIQRIRISYIDPIIDLTAPSLGPVSREYLILIDRAAAKRLNNQFLRVICADGTVKEHRLVSNGYGCKLKVGSIDGEGDNYQKEASL